MTTDKTKVDVKRVRTPEFRVSFPSVFKPKSFEGQDPKYSIVMLFPEKTDISKLKAAATAALIEKFGEKSKWPKNLKSPFRDGDEKEDTQGYKGHIFVTASSKQKPGLVNNLREPITDESEFYAGCYAHATVQAFAYNTAGNKGVSFALQNIQKLRDGESFSGRKRAEDDFEVIEDGSDDESNYSSDDLGLG